MKSEVDWMDIRERYQQGETISQIARELGMDRKTVRKYAQSGAPPEHAGHGNALLDPYKEYIVGRLKLHPLSAVRILEEIQERGYTGGYTAVKEFMRPLRNDRAIAAEIRFETPPGEQAQVDWIDFGQVELDGESAHLRGFAMVLGYSRMCFVVFTTDVTTPTFITCHLTAFGYFAGYTNTILYDNTKNVVLKRAVVSSDSEWNPLFKDFFLHYGFTPRLCKPGIEGAKTKGKVERIAQYVEDNFFLGREFSSLSELNSHALGWCDKVNSRVHGTTFEVPVERFKVEGLRPFAALPPYQVVQTEFRRASRDCFVSYMGNRYSVPWRYAGRECRLRINGERFEVAVDDEVVAAHETVPGAHRCIRIKEHFDGLYKAIRDSNQERHMDRIAAIDDRPRVMIPHPPVDVGRRELSVYDSFAGTGGVR